jgi:hypothetical protein
MSPTPTQPVAQGTLANTPFAHLVLFIYQRRSSGTLFVRGARTSSSGSQTLAVGEPVKVLFHRGRAVAAHVSAPADALDHALLPLCAMRDGDYEFFEEDLVGSGAAIVTGMFDPYAFVTEAARRFTPEPVIDQVLQRFAEIPLCVQPGMDLERLLLLSQEAKFAEALRDGTATIGTLLQARDLPGNQARRVLYALLVTKVVGPFAPTQEETQSAPPPDAAVPSLPQGKSSAAPTGRNSSLSAEQRRRQSSAAWAAIAARASQASRPLSAPIGASPRSPTPARSFTPAPGADRSITAPPSAASASPAQVHKTPSPSAAVAPSARPPTRSVTPPGSFGVRRTPMRPETPSAPPGRVIDPPLEQQRPVSGPISNNSAPRVTTPSRPISRVTPRPNSEPVEELDAAGRFRRVQALCQRNAFGEALPIIRALVEEERRNPVYLGMLASALYGHGNQGTISKEIVETVNQALRIHPDEVNALYTKARCYKRMGKNREALHYFRRTVAVDPAHLEAAREVRLLLLRQSEKPKR